METLEVLRRKIEASEDLRSVVRTMKSLSAVSIRQYEHAAEALAVYRRTVELGLHVVLQERLPPAATLRVQDGRTAAIVLGSDHGLCGRFNEQVCRFARETLRELAVVQGEAAMLAVGSRAAALLESVGEPADEAFTWPGSAAGLSRLARALLVVVDAWRSERGVVRVLLFHNVGGESATAVPQMATLLPVDLARLRLLAERRWPSRRLPSFTMEARRLFATLIREYFFVSVVRAAAESLASEHATRLAAMQMAERNIDEHLEEIQAAFRHKRQESITEELLDLIAGFESLAGERSERAAD